MSSIVLFTDLASPGVEVVTSRTDSGSLESVVHDTRKDGKLDGFCIYGEAGDDAKDLHEKLLRLSRMTAWEKRGTFGRR